MIGNSLLQNSDY